MWNFGERWRNTPWDVSMNMQRLQKIESVRHCLSKILIFLKGLHVFRKAEGQLHYLSFSIWHLALISFAVTVLPVYLAYGLLERSAGSNELLWCQQCLTARKLGNCPLLLIPASPRFEILPVASSFPIAWFCLPSAGLWTQNTFLVFIMKYFFAR